ncbi:MAG: TonB family protein [Campylobacterota bacterium]|nr:TonB family protein [Campylobacterota bacterium]
MLRNSSALVLSFFIHTAIALAVVMLYTLYKEHVDVKEKPKPICLCLSQVKEKVIAPPPAKELPKPLKSIKKEVVKKIELPKPVKKKIVKPKVKPQKKVIVTKKVEVLKEPEVPVIVASEVELAPVELQPPKSVKEEYLEEHLMLIAQLLKKNLYYPKRARKRHFQGKVLMRFTLKSDGSISNISVVEGSKNILNRAAIKTINKLSGKVPKPVEPITIEIPIVFRLK